MHTGVYYKQIQLINQCTRTKTYVNTLKPYMWYLVLCCVDWCIIIGLSGLSVDACRKKREWMKKCVQFIDEIVIKTKFSGLLSIVLIIFQKHMEKILSYIF